MCYLVVPVHCPRPVTFIPKKKCWGRIHCTNAPGHDVLCYKPRLNHCPAPGNGRIVNGIFKLNISVKSHTVQKQTFWRTMFMLSIMLTYTSPIYLKPWHCKCLPRCFLKMLWGFLPPPPIQAAQCKFQPLSVWKKSPSDPLQPYLLLYTRAFLL